MRCAERIVYRHGGAERAGRRSCAGGREGFTQRPCRRVGEGVGRHVDGISAIGGDDERVAGKARGKIGIGVDRSHNVCERIARGSRIGKCVRAVGEGESVSGCERGSGCDAASRLLACGADGRAAARVKVGEQLDKARGVGRNRNPQRDGQRGQSLIGTYRPVRGCIAHHV